MHFGGLAAAHVTASPQFADSSPLSGVVCNADNDGSEQIAGQAVVHGGFARAMKCQ
jgi:hypothetical protein